MKKAILFLLLVICIAGSSQKNVQKPGKALLNNDSVLAGIEQLKDSVVQSNLQHDSLQPVLSFNNNLDQLIKMQKEREAKQKRSAIIRIAIGVLLLLLMFIGLMRKRKKISQV